MGCACMGPQNGEPLCPCQMRVAREHISREIPPILQPQARGCICPAGAEATCKGFACPRQPFNITF